MIYLVIAISLSLYFPQLVSAQESACCQKTKSGIYIPGDEGEKPQSGTVIACGEAIWESGVKEIECPVKKGAQVIYKKWGGNEFKVGDKEYMFIKFEDLLAEIK